MKKLSFLSLLALRKRGRQKRLRRLVQKWMAQMPLKSHSIAEVDWQSGQVHLPSFDLANKMDEANQTAAVLVSYDLIDRGQSPILSNLIGQTKCSTLCFVFKAERPCSVSHWVEVLDQHRFHKREVRRLPWPLKAHIAFAHRSSL